MINEIQFVLFFANETMYKLSKMGFLIKEKFPEIGEAIILPINIEASQENNQPFIIFNQNPNLQILANFNNIRITVKNSFIIRLEEIVFTILKLFLEEDVALVRVGYVPSLMFDANKKNDFKTSCMNSNIFMDTIDFQFSWLKKLKFDNININCWERSISDSDNFDGLLKMYDFNTCMNQDIIIDKKFIKSFLSFCNRYIDQEN